MRNLPVRSSDTSLKDGLFHEYKKHGKVTWVKVVGQNADRHAIVCFKKPEDAEKALEVSYDKLFFGCKIEVSNQPVRIQTLRSFAGLIHCNKQCI